MRRIVCILAVVTVAGTVSCESLFRRTPPPAPAPPPPPRGSLTLAACSGVAQSTGTVTVTDITVTTIVTDGAGDQVAVPPGGAPLGTVLTLTRIGGGPNRMVRAEATNTVTNATVTLEFGGCAANGTNVRVAHVPSGGSPYDVGAHVSGTKVTSDPLPHLSIYAVATT